MMKIEIDADLAAAIADMIAVNGLSATKYVNNLVERGLRQDLAETHTEGSVREFMGALAADRRPNWGLLVVGEECDECGNAIPDVNGGGRANRHHATSCSLYDPNLE